MTKWSGAETLECGAMNGAILKNYVVAEIRKTYLNCGKEPYLYYYYDKDVGEIDIVQEHDVIFNPIEIKKTANPGTELVKVFELLDMASTPRATGVVICMKPGLSAIGWPPAALPCTFRSTTPPATEPPCCCVRPCPAAPWRDG